MVAAIDVKIPTLNFLPTPHKAPMRIFISIACFLDADIVLTIKDCLSKAAEPDRLVFGVCLQSAQGEPFFDEFKDHPQVRLFEIDYRQAKGPTYARYLCVRAF